MVNQHNNHYRALALAAARDLATGGLSTNPTVDAGTGLKLFIQLMDANPRWEVTLWWNGLDERQQAIQRRLFRHEW